STRDVALELLDVIAGRLPVEPVWIPADGEGLVLVEDGTTVVTEPCVMQDEVGREPRVGARRRRRHRRDGVCRQVRPRPRHERDAVAARGAHVDHHGPSARGSEQRERHGRERDEQCAAHQLPPAVRLRWSTIAPTPGSYGNNERASYLSPLMSLCPVFETWRRALSASATVLCDVVRIAVTAKSETCVGPLAPEV